MHRNLRPPQCVTSSVRIWALAVASCLGFLLAPRYVCAYGWKTERVFSHFAFLQLVLSIGWCLQWIMHLLRWSEGWGGWMTFVVDCNKDDVLWWIMHLHRWSEGWGGLMTFVVDCNKDDVLWWIVHLHRWSEGWGGLMTYMTFVVDCKQGWCSLVDNAFA